MGQFSESGFYGGCNTDIQLHINKGVIGLRIDNIVGFEVDNVTISNLINTGDLGTETEICGAYTQGNAHQDPLITAGYTGTEGYGITITQSTNGTLRNIAIDNLETFYGFATGIALFKDSKDVQFEEDIRISNVNAGSMLEVTDLRPEEGYLPNKIPIGCSIYNNEYNTEYTLDDNVQISASDISGYLLCTDDAVIGPQCDESQGCIAKYDETYFEELKLSVALSASGERSLQNTANYSWIVILCALLTVIAASMCYFWSKSLEIDVRKSEIDNENTPLLYH